MSISTEKDLRVIYGTCPHDCPDCCAIETHVDTNGTAVLVKGRSNHPVTRGWLCAKVNRYLERVYHPDRLLYPLRRVGPKGSGEWEQISWDDAISEITTRWQDIVSTTGAQAILPYSYAGTLGLVQGKVTDTRFWNRLGACELERSICGEAATEAVQLTVGGRLAPPPEMLLQSKLILIWGSNPASTAPHLMPFIREAQRQGTKIIVIDPIRTRTARSATQHIQPYPGTDAALALGMMHVIVSHNLHKQTWLEQHTLGWEGLLERVQQFPPAYAAKVTGLDQQTIIDLALDYATTTPALLRVSDGINRHTNGGQTVRTLACLPAVIGQYGIRGGGLMYSTSDWIHWDKDIATRANDPACPPPPRMVNMNRLGAVLTGEADPPIRSLYVYNANPVASTPNTGAVLAGLLREDLFTVVHDLFLTDTAHYADIVLPATSQLEQVDLHKPYGHTSINYNRAAIEPMGEARSNWDTMRALAKGMGFQEDWLQEDVETVIRTILEASRAANPLLKDITFERLLEEGAIPVQEDREDDVPFADGYFPTPSGKVEIYSEQAKARGYDPLPGWVPEVEEYTGITEQTASRRDQLPLLCPAAHHFVSSTFGNQARMREKEKEPTLFIHPHDAAARGIRNGSMVRVSNERGWCRLIAHVSSDDVRPGVLATTTVWWPSHSPDQRGINWLTSDRLADFNGGSTFYTNLVTVRPDEEISSKAEAFS